MASGKSKARARDDLICVGVVSTARGLRGEVRIKSFTADPADVCAYGPLFDKTGQRTFKVRITGSAKGQLIARIEGVEDREAADALKGVGLHVPREALPQPEKGEFYHADLIGLRAQTTDGSDVGTVKEVQEYGGGSILEIAGGTWGEVMIPFTTQAVPVVDLAGGRVVIDTPPGLLDDAEDGKASGGNEGNRGKT
jgi:16S rRNA processing protein RimM